MSRNLALKAVLALLVAAASGGAWAAPLLAEDGPHDGWNVIPLSPLSGAGRYQQVYSSSLFSGSVDINSIAFATDRDSIYSADIAIRFTTTSAAVGLLSASLDSNFSAPLTTVFSATSFSQPVAGGSESFGLTFDFGADAFSYDPAAGNLLLDILIGNQSIVPLQFPAFAAFSMAAADGSAYSRAWDTGAFGAGSDGFGLRTMFDVTPIAAPIPEPETYAMLLAGLALIGFIGRRRYRAS